MSTKERPWFKFFPADWAQDIQLGKCSLPARAVWINCLGMAHHAKIRGFVLLPGDTNTSDDDLIAELAFELRADQSIIKSTLRELEHNGVFSRDKDGRIYSRRMVSDEKRFKMRQKGGKIGGAIRREQLKNSPEEYRLELTQNTREPENQKTREPDSTARKRSRPLSPDELQAFKPTSEQIKKLITDYRISFDPLKELFTDWKNHHVEAGTKIKAPLSSFRTWIRNQINWGKIDQEDNPSLKSLRVAGSNTVKRAPHELPTSWLRMTPSKGEFFKRTDDISKQNCTRVDGYNVDGLPVYALTHELDECLEMLKQGGLL